MFTKQHWTLKCPKEPGHFLQDCNSLSGLGLYPPQENEGKCERGYGNIYQKQLNASNLAPVTLLNPYSNPLKRFYCPIFQMGTLRLRGDTVSTW